MTDWYYAAKGAGQAGPVSAERLAELLQAGDIGGDSLVWRDGLDNWLPLRRFFDELGLRENAPADPGTILDGSAPAPAAPELPPELPPEPPAPTSPAHVPVMTAPPPRSGMSGCAIAMIVLAVLAVPVIAILAAIAIPAYSSYVHRAAVSAALAQATTIKPAVVAFRERNGSCPENDSEGFQAAESYAQGRLAAIKLGHFDNGNCGMELRLRGDDLEGKSLWLEYADDDWHCSSDIKDTMLPFACRSH